MVLDGSTLSWKELSNVSKNIAKINDTLRRELKCPKSFLKFPNGDFGQRVLKTVGTVSFAFWTQRFWVKSVDFLKCLRIINIWAWFTILCQRDSICFLLGYLKHILNMLEEPKMLFWLVALNTSNTCASMLCFEVFSDSKSRNCRWKH